MTPNPECATVDTPIVDALHTMHDGKFLHLPVVDRGKSTFMSGDEHMMIIYKYICDALFCYINWMQVSTMHVISFSDSLIFDSDGIVVAVVDVLHITHAAVATVSPISIYLLWNHA